MILFVSSTTLFTLISQIILIFIIMTKREIYKHKSASEMNINKKNIDRKFILKYNEQDLESSNICFNICSSDKI